MDAVGRPGYGSHYRSGTLRRARSRSVQSSSTVSIPTLRRSSAAGRCLPRNASPLFDGGPYRTQAGGVLEALVRGIGSGLIFFRGRADRIADELVAGLRPRETEAAIARRSGLPDFHRHPAISDGFCFAEIRQIRT